MTISITAGSVQTRTTGWGLLPHDCLTRTLFHGMAHLSLCVEWMGGNYWNLSLNLVFSRAHVHYLQIHCVFLSEIHAQNRPLEKKFIFFLMSKNVPDLHLKSTSGLVLYWTKPFLKGCELLMASLYIVACQRGGVSNELLGQRQDTGPGILWSVHRWIQEWLT